jgi:uncharacterized protein YbjT (DUF2867 family)
MNKILITGATGNVGSELLKLLRDCAADVDVMTSKPATQNASVLQEFTIRQASFEHVAQLIAAFQGINTLFVLLPLVPGKLQLAHNVAQAAKTAGVKHIVRSSGAGADAQSPYALPRLQGQIDDVLAATGIACTFLRNAGFMQNYSTFMAPMVKSGMIYAASADAPQSLIDVRDIAAVAATIVRNPAPHIGKAYTLTGGESLTDTQRAAVLSRAIGKPVHFTAIPLEAAENAMRNEWHLPEDMVQWMNSLNRLVSVGHASAVSGDVQNLLDRTPTTFTHYARDNVKAWV